jgi:hypothetical protein
MTNSEPIDWDIDVQADNEEIYESLVRALAQTEGFGLFFVRCVEKDRAKLKRRIKEDLALQDRVCLANTGTEGGTQGWKLISPSGGGFAEVRAIEWLVYFWLGKIFGSLCKCRIWRIGRLLQQRHYTDSVGTFKFATGAISR